uniref:Uncharacterized protein n=1 Tax=Coccidioides posadasii RMSCC 3488 TaxID=454284 RepID=A0A0J6FJT9_COCPO|nr:hypothetical protein CPAG_05422 [Coccidioides posadasii RMSCC 3488]
MLSLPSRVTAYKNASGGPPLKYAGIWTNGDDHIAVYERLCPPDLRTGFKTLPHVGEMGPAIFMSQGHNIATGKNQSITGFQQLFKHPMCSRQSLRAIVG